MISVSSLDWIFGVRAEWTRLMRDTRALGAVEFALIVPLMLVMFFGVVEISSGVSIDRKVSMVTQTTSDLVSRYKSVTDTDISSVFTIANAMLTPYASAPMKAKVTEVYINPVTGNACVQWSRAVNDTKYADSAVLAVPADLIARDSTNKIVANQYLIFSEVKYVYTPTVGYVLAKSGITLGDRTYTRPRLSSCVLLNPGSSDTCSSIAPKLC
jgi:Flp pilus assembly protein TadG